MLVVLCLSALMACWTLANDDWSCHIPLLHVGVHTNTVEGCWKWAKQAMTHAKVHSDEWLYLYLQTYMWCKWRGEPHPGGVFQCLLADLSRCMRCNDGVVLV